MFTPQVLLAFGVLILSVTGAAAYVTLDILTRRAPARQRLRGAGGDAGSLLETRLPLTDAELDPRLARASRFLPKSPKDLSRLRRRMARAG